MAPRGRAGSAEQRPCHYGLERVVLHHVHFATKGSGVLGEHRELGSAHGAPRGEEVDHDRPAMQARQRDIARCPETRQHPSLSGGLVAGAGAVVDDGEDDHPGEDRGPTTLTAMVRSRRRRIAAPRPPRLDRATRCGRGGGWRCVAGAGVRRPAPGPGRGTGRRLRLVLISSVRQVPGRSARRGALSASRGAALGPGLVGAPWRASCRRRGRRAGGRGRRRSGGPGPSWGRPAAGWPSG